MAPMAAPAYEELPPSYESIMTEVNAQIDKDSSLEGLQNVVANLSEKQVNVILSKNDTDELKKTEKKIENDKKAQVKFRQALADAMNSDAAKRHLEVTADMAAAACKAINAAFNALETKLGTIDALSTAAGQEKFSPAFLAIRADFNDTLLKSKQLATSISTYAERFDEVIIPLVIDSDVPLRIKENKLDEFIKDANKFSTESENMKKKFDNVTTTLRSLSAKFASWSTGKEASLQAQVDTLTKEIEALTKEIEEFQTQLLVSGSVAAGSLPVFGLIAVCCPVIAPFAIIAGVISAGTATGFAISYAVRITDRKARKVEKEKEKKALMDQMAGIVATRNSLKETGEKTLKEVEANINLLANVWIYAMNDAVAVREHLENAKKDMVDTEFDKLGNVVSKTPIPAYLGMANESGKAAGIYKQLAVYLRRYADGV